MLAYGAICGNVTYAFGVFLPSMGESFGWSRSALSGPYTLFLIIGGMLGPLAGVTVARFGARKNIVLAMSLRRWVCWACPRFAKSGRFISFSE